MKPDIVIAWPGSCDYPLWRQMIRDNRDRFDKIIIIFTKTNYGHDYRGFVAGAMQRDNCIFVDNAPVRGDQDWRNIAVNIGLEHSNSEWVWFTEQDFLPLAGFWSVVDSAMQSNYHAIGILEGERIHPASLFVKRELIQKTKRDFGVVPDIGDHFYRFVKDIKAQKDIWIVDKPYWSHMNGLSQNYSMLFNGEKPNWRPDEFREYLEKCLAVTVAQDSRFRAFAQGYLFP